MKKNGKKIIIIFSIILLLVVGILFFVFAFDLKNENALTLEENKWIDENKYDVIDVALLNDTPILSDEGEGLVYDYLDYITKNHSLKFNVVPHKLDSAMEYQYKMNIVDKVSDKEIELLKDNFVLVTINNLDYKDISEINNLKIGVLNTEKTLISNYLNNSSLNYVEYSNYNDLKNSIINSKTMIEQGIAEYEVDAIVILKTMSMKEIIQNNLNIAYQFNDLNKYYVLSTTGNKRLNSIFSKTFNTWKLDSFDDKYNSYLLSEYYKFKGLSDVERKTLKSKNYVYGFINYGIYN